MRVSGRAGKRPHHTAEVLVRARRQVEDHVPGRLRVAAAAGGQPTRVSGRRHVVAPAARVHTVHERMITGRGVGDGHVRTVDRRLFVLTSSVALHLLIVVPLVRKKNKMVIRIRHSEFAMRTTTV